MKTISFIIKSVMICTGLLFLPMQAIFADILPSEAELRSEKQLDVEQIHPGVYRSKTENGTRIYGYNKGGMEYDLARHKNALESAQNRGDEEHASFLRRQINLLETALREQSGSGEDTLRTDQDSGGLCRASYDIEADTGRASVWDFYSRADASATQFAGPPPPYAYHISSYATSENFDGLYHYVFTDAESDVINGIGGITLPTVQELTDGVYPCHYVEAGASILVTGGCSGDTYRSVYEDFLSWSHSACTEPPNEL